MVLLLILLLFGAAVILAGLMWVWLWRRKAAWVTHLAFAAVGVTGILIGIFFSHRFEYRFNPTTRISGFPLPVAIHKMEGGQWTTLAFPIPLAWLMLGANAAVMGAAASSLVAILSAIGRKRHPLET